MLKAAIVVLCFTAIDLFCPSVLEYQRNSCSPNTLREGPVSSTCLEERFDRCLMFSNIYSYQNYLM